MFLNDVEVYNFYINFLNLNIPYHDDFIFAILFKSGSYLD